MKVSCCIDHLVVAADTLERGVRWCESTLGVTPGPGGEHADMGTHNRLLRIATSEFPRAYLEIIAINPQAKAPSHKRWFDLDDPGLQHDIRRRPRLVHFVARTRDAAAALKALRAFGVERGALVAAERATSQGKLRWQISLRGDGQRLFYGALPTLIQWADTHPADFLPDCGVTLQSLRASHPRASDLLAAHAAIGLQGVLGEEGAPNLAATLATPLGTVTIESHGT